MSAMTEHVPAASLRKGDFVTIPHRREDPFDGEVVEAVFAVVSRDVVAPQASDRVLVSYTCLAGGAGTVDLGPDDLVMRVRERQAS